MSMTYRCDYHGKQETCLMKDKFPVTKNGKINKKRVRSAESYGSKYGYLETLKRNGLCRYVRKAKIKKSKICN